LCARSRFFCAQMAHSRLITRPPIYNGCLYPGMSKGRSHRSISKWLRYVGGRRQRRRRLRRSVALALALVLLLGGWILLHKHKPAPAPLVKLVRVVPAENTTALALPARDPSVDPVADPWDDLGRGGKCKEACKASLRQRIAHLTISVPEPASQGLLIGGFLALIAAAAHRRRRARANSADR
jgi:hypothetical protein